MPSLRGDYPVTMLGDPTRRSVGRVTDTNPDPTRDFPAKSFLDVLFQIDTCARAEADAGGRRSA